MAVAIAETTYCIIVYTVHYTLYSITGATTRSSPKGSGNATQRNKYLVWKNANLGLMLDVADLAEPAVTGSRRHTAAVYRGHVLLLEQRRGLHKQLSTNKTRISADCPSSLLSAPCASPTKTSTSINSNPSITLESQSIGAKCFSCKDERFHQ